MEVKQIIPKLNTNKSTGLDSIDRAILKSSGDSIIHCITSIINKQLS
jgi:hypothetical protein